MTAVGSTGMGETAARAEVGDGVIVRAVPFDAPWDWLAHGWRDMWEVPQVSLAYGAAFALVALLLTFGLTQYGIQSMILPLAGGFMLLGPFMAIGLYETSRRLQKGLPVSLGAVISESLRPKGQMSFMGLILMLIFLAWMQIAFLMFMLFWGDAMIPPASEFIPSLLFTARGLGLLIAGTVVGGVIALIVFAISAVSVPLLMRRNVGVATAISASAKALQLSPRAMLLWAALIAGFTVLGLLTLFVGLVFSFPLIGHATWYAFRDLIVPLDPADDPRA